MRDDIKAALWYVADTYKARIFVQKPSFGTKHNGAGRRFRFAVFGIEFIRTPYHNNPNVPDEKIVWDARCLRLQEDIEDEKGRTSGPPHMPLYPLKATDYEGIIVVPLANLRRPLFDDYADIPARKLKAAKEEEVDFYEGRDCIKAALARDGVSLMYREMFQYAKRTYALTAITPDAQSQSYIFTATCVEDEEEKAVGEKLKLTYQEVIKRVIADRRQWA